MPVGVLVGGEGGAVGLGVGDSETLAGVLVRLIVGVGEGVMLECDHVWLGGDCEKDGVGGEGV